MKLLNIILYISLHIGLSKAQYNKYIIKENDTCYDIINENNIYNHTFYEINPMIDCNNLKINGTINLSNNNTIVISKQDLNDLLKINCNSKINN